MPQAAPSALPANSLEVMAALAFAAILAGALALIAGGVMRRLLASVEGRTTITGPLQKAPVRLVRLLAFVIAFIALAFPTLAFVGVTLPVELRGERVGEWVARTGLRIGIIVLLALAATRLARSTIARAEHEMAAGGSVADIERRKRAQTIGRTFNRFLSALIWIAALLMVLRAIDVDITPVLTGAGILGLAVGFGAQTLVKDVISGFFLIVEDQVRVGDAAIVNGTGGTVEQINLRTIVLRDLEGTVHVFPNGEVKTLANRSKDFSYYVLDIGIDYGDDVDAAIDVVRTTAAEMQGDPAWGPHILEPLEVMGVDDFGASAVSLRFRIKTAPLSQWGVGRELRRRVKKAFDAHGLRIPVQQIEVTMRAPAAPARQG
ncbi:MAG: mechanosensitive ion channel family protein [Vicinamibacterales bacterium]